MSNQNKTLILIIGPESTATRAFAKAFTQHPKILSVEDPSEHIDILDEVWYELENNNEEHALANFPVNHKKDIIVTRRSVPHGLRPGMAARYMSFPNTNGLKRICDRLGYELFILITSRSPIPNLVSWTNERASAQGEINKAYMQYQMSYREIFKFIEAYNVPYFIVSLEGFVLDKKDLIKSLHLYFGLPNEKISVQSRNNVNKRRYEEYFGR